MPEFQRTGADGGCDYAGGEEQYKEDHQHHGSRPQTETAFLFQLGMQGQSRQPRPVPGCGQRIAPLTAIGAAKLTEEAA